MIDCFLRSTGRAIAVICCLQLASTAVQAQTTDTVDSKSALPAPKEILRDWRKLEPVRGVEELKQIEIGGIKQWISVRGRDRRNPILLFIHGGPAAPEMPASWTYQSPWEDYFTVVQWDQRGAGKTGAANDPKAVAPTISVDRMVADAEELVTFLRKTYGKEKIYVLGHSWGSVIGLRLAHSHPEWLHAYIGMGQAIYMQDNERLGYEFALRQARLRGNAQAQKELEAIAPYPGPFGPSLLEKVGIQRKWVIEFGGLTWGRSDFKYEENLALLSPDYIDGDSEGSDFAGTLTRLAPALLATDFRSTTKLEVPTFIFAGRYDYETPSAVAAEWFRKLTAPKKGIFWFEHSAHMMQQEQPGKVFMHLVRDIRPLAVSAGDAAPEDAPGEGG